MKRDFMPAKASLRVLSTGLGASQAEASCWIWWETQQDIDQRINGEYVGQKGTHYRILHGGFYYADVDLFIDLNDGTRMTNTLMTRPAKLSMMRVKTLRRWSLWLEKGPINVMGSLHGTTCQIKPSGPMIWCWNTTKRERISRTMLIKPEIGPKFENWLMSIKSAKLIILILSYI